VFDSTDLLRERDDCARSLLIALQQQDRIEPLADALKSGGRAYTSNNGFW